jgi:hypothetical protein
MKKVLKWLGIGVVSAFAFMGIVGLVGAVAMMATDSGQTQANAEPKQEKTPEAKPAADKHSEAKVQPKLQQSGQDAIAGAQAYYDAASAGEFVYTYQHLGYEARGVYTQDQWNTLNEANGSAGAAYAVQSATPAGQDTYQIDLTVNGTPRTTYFILDGGEWFHLPTDEEYAMYDGGLIGGATSTSASAPASSAGSTGEDQIRVVVSANTPVDVSIISAEDLDAPMISEQVQSKTYEFALQPGADLSVSASDPESDFAASDDISVEVYKNGQLQAEDSDGFMALVQF